MTGIVRRCRRDLRAVALITLRRAAPGRLGLTAYPSALALYVSTGTLAIAPHIAVPGQVRLVISHR